MRPPGLIGHPNFYRVLAGDDAIFACWSFINIEVNSRLDHIIIINIEVNSRLDHIIIIKSCLIPNNIRLSFNMIGAPRRDEEQVVIGREDYFIISSGDYNPFALSDGGAGDLHFDLATLITP